MSAQFVMYKADLILIHGDVLQHSADISADINVALHEMRKSVVQYSDILCSRGGSRFKCCCSNPFLFSLSPYWTEITVMKYKM